MRPLLPWRTELLDRNRDESRRRVAIIGAGGHAREILDLLEACRDDGQRIEPLGFLVDPEFRPPEAEVNGWPILGGLDWIETKAKEVEIVVAVGAPELRRRLAAEARSLGARFATLVHPHATTTRRVSLGAGSVVMAGSRLTNNIRIGEHVHVTQNCSVAHDTNLGDFVSVFAGAVVSGNVRLGEGVLLGAGAVVVEKVAVGAWTRIGAGSTVLDDLPADVTAVGSPARIVRRRNLGWQLGPER